jgi:sugar-specific transcriptional regulator TrmB
LEPPVLPPFENDIELLSSLGLSHVQAKVYLLLVDSGTLTVNSISKVSKINRGDVYRAISKLLELNMVEKNIESPVKFSPVPIQAGISILLEQKDKNYTELKKKAFEIMNRYKRRTHLVHTEDEQKSQFILLPEKAAKAKIREATKNMRISLDLINTWRMRQLAFYNQDEVREKALDRGVCFRIITDRPPNGQSITGSRIIKESPKHLVRYCASPVNALLRIFDGKEIFILTSSSINSQESDALWSCNPSLIAICQSYFDILWQTSIECEKNKTNEL